MRARPMAVALALGLGLLLTGGAARAQPIGIALVTSDGDFDGEFEVVGLPAVSSDGYVALAYVDPDGARGNPNLTFDVRRAEDDGLVWRLAVLSPDEYDEEAFANVPGRLDAVAAFLRLHPWEPLQPVPLQFHETEDAFPDMTRAELAGERPLHLLATEHRLVLSTIAGGPAQVLSTDWGAEAESDDEPECAGLNAPALMALWVSPDHATLLMRVDFYGTDMCWEPPPVYQVLRVARSPATTTVPACAQRGGSCLEGCEGRDRSIGPHDCVDATCCLPAAVPVLCELVAGASCQPGCDGAAEVAHAFCPDDAVCCAPP